MGLGWYTSQNSVIKVLMIEVPFVRMVQTSKHFDMIIIPFIASDNQPVHQPTEGANNFKFSLNEVGTGLVSGQVCSKAFPWIAPTVVHVLEFGGDPSKWDHKNLLN